MTIQMKTLKDKWIRQRTRRLDFHIEHGKDTVMLFASPENIVKWHLREGNKGMEHMSKAQSGKWLLKLLQCLVEGENIAGCIFLQNFEQK